MAGHFEGLTILQSGQPYSVIDYSGAVGSIFYGTNDGITNPIVPLAPGCTPKSALTGIYGVTSGESRAQRRTASRCRFWRRARSGGAIPSNDPYETNFIASGQRNIFRQPWQRRADISIVKNTQVNERVSVRYSLRCVQPDEHRELRHPDRQRRSKHQLQRLPGAGAALRPTTPCDTSFHRPCTSAQA